MGFAGQFLLGLAGVGTTALLVLKVPSCMLEHSKTAATNCFEHYDAVHGKENDGTVLDPAECAAGASLGLAKLAPHTKREAKEFGDELESRVRYRVVKRAEGPTATAADRKRAIEYLMRAKHDPSLQAMELLSFGEYEQTAKLELVKESYPSRNYPLYAALTIGDFARAKATLDQPSKLDEHAGAVACLIGAKEKGLEILAKVASSQYASTSPARIAAILCGATTPASFGGVDPYAEDDLYYEASMIARAFDPAFQTGKREAFGRWLRKEIALSRHVRLAGNVLAIGAVEQDPLDLFRIVAGHEGILSVSNVVQVSPWTTLRARSYSDGGNDYLPPSWLVAAAERVNAALAKPAPKGPTDDIDREFEFDRVDPALLKDTHGAFRAAAARLHAYAASYALRAGRRDLAKESITILQATNPASLDLAVLQLTLGDAKAAIETLDKWDAANASSEVENIQALRGVSLVNRVLALGTLGDYAAAHAAALKANPKDPIMGWLIVATAIAAKVPLQGLPLPAASKADDASTWLAALTKSGETPRGYDYDAEIVLPAVMVVIGHAATVAGGDAEAFLDERLNSADVPSRTFLRARAEAARWRGDAASAKRWDDRATSIEKLFVDDRATALAGIAGLW